MFPQPSLTIEQQIDLLKSRGMSFSDEAVATHFLENVGFTRLKGYWSNMYRDSSVQDPSFITGSSFEQVIKVYNFDRHFKLILFDALERIEIALRTKMALYLSESDKNALWFYDWGLFKDSAAHIKSLGSISMKVSRNKEPFIRIHREANGSKLPEGWKALETLDFRDLSVLFENLKNDLPLKGKISRSMGFNLNTELTSWLKSFVYLRNIIAHHSRIYSRTLIKEPKFVLRNPIAPWLTLPLPTNQRNKTFLIVSAILYTSNCISPGHSIKQKLVTMLTEDADLPIEQVGFYKGWQEHPLWK